MGFLMWKRCAFSFLSFNPLTSRWPCVNFCVSLAYLSWPHGCLEKNLTQGKHCPFSLGSLRWLRYSLTYLIRSDPFILFLSRGTFSWRNFMLNFETNSMEVQHRFQSLTACNPVRTEWRRGQWVPKTWNLRLQWIISYSGTKWNAQGCLSTMGLG